MKEEIRELGDLYVVLRDIAESFRPNGIVSPYPENTYLSNVKLKPVEEVDLSVLPLETLIYVRGQHINASFWLLRLFEQNEQRQVDIWRNLDSDGLRGRIDKIISVDIREIDGKTKWIMDRGILRKEANMAFPYFNYEPNPNRPGKVSVCIPESYWMDSYRRIELVER